MSFHLGYSRDDLNSVWKVLQSGLDKILCGENIDVSSYIRMYSAIHGFCTRQTGVSSNNHGIIGGGRRGPHLLGEELYYRLSAYLKQALSKMHKHAETLSNEKLLDYYNEQWNRFLAFSRFNNSLWTFLDRNWIRGAQNEGEMVDSIFDLHLRRWKLDMLDTMHANLAEILLDLIRKQRDGEYVEQLPRKSFINSIMSLRKFSEDGTEGLKDKKINTRLTQKWGDIFRSSTTEYYEKVAFQDISEFSPEEYINKVERRILDEEKNTALFLPDHMKFTILRTCEKALITDHLDLHLDAFSELLRLDDYSRLGQVYRLLNRVPSGLDTCYDNFEKHIRQAGLAAVDEAIASAPKNEVTNDGRESIDHNLFSESLSRTIEKYQRLVKVSFNSNKEFNRSVDRACRAFVNWNRACMYDSDAPEILAKHTESLLKQRSGRAVSEADLLDKLAKSVLIFKYLEDKDAFITLYSRMLAKRLLQGTSVSDQAEKSMLSKIHEVYDHTNKLKQMLLDMDTFKDIDNRFEQWWFTQGGGIQDLSLKSNLDQATRFPRSFKVVSQANWPLKPPDTPFNVPLDIAHVHDEFRQFYQSEYPGRALHWHWHLCHGDLRMNPKSGPEQGYILHGSAYQIAILLLFNSKDELSYKEIEEGTGLMEEQLSPLLAFFLKAKLVKLEDRDQSKVYILNDDFASKKVKIDIRISVKRQKNAEMGELHRKIKEERKLLLQAAIVRIMKSRRKLTYQQLAVETISQLKARFAPKDNDLKSCVDLLIDKEFLERLDEGSLGYLA